MAKGFKNSIENVFNRMMLYSLITAGITILVGIALWFLPSLSNKIIGIITGIVFLLAGANTIYKYLYRDGAKLYSLNLVFAILYLLLGAVIIVYPFSVMNFITVCLGIYMIINAASKINYGFWLKKGNEDCWLITLISGVLLLIIGVLILFNPFATLTITKLAGIFLLLSGILDFTNTFLFKKRSKEIMEIFW